jgi:hypothetical protein
MTVIGARMDGRLYDQEAEMNRDVTRLVQAGKYVAEVTVVSIPDDGAWGPYLSLEDAKKLQTVEKALKRGDLKAAAQLARVYELRPVAAE